VRSSEIASIRASIAWLREHGAMSVDADSRSLGERASSFLRPLWLAFGIQIAGRLLDFWWHGTHDGFETGGDQLQAHWLVWIGTILVLIVGLRAPRQGVQGQVRSGFLVVVWANALYIPIAVAHFIQHMNHQEVDWAHLGLAITNIASAIGVLYVTYASANRVKVTV
jgi:hypothetical protein